MNDIRRLRRTDATILPWKNGRGETTQIALWPPNAAFGRGDFDWRLSRAAVVEDGAFSSFPGFDRALVIVDGAGLRLEHGEARSAALLAPLRPYVFSGDDRTTATLVEGPVQDFNLMWRRGKARAEVRVIEPAGKEEAIFLGSDHAILHAVRGTIEVMIGEGLEAVALEPFETLWLQGAAARTRARIRPSDAACAWIIARIDMS